MDKYKFLILLKGEDRTEEVRSFNYDSVSKKNRVVFNNGKEYYYHYNNSRIIKYENKIFIKNKKLYIKHLRIYDNPDYLYEFGEYYKYFMNSKTHLVFKYNVIITESESERKPNSRNAFEYLKEIANEIENDSNFDKLKYNNAQSYFGKLYDEIDIFRNDTLLNNHFSKKILKKQTRSRLVIFPFGINKSQFEAVINSLENRASIIEGPPGTGKTQTILNIISNYIINDKRIAVVSNNNDAIKNIYDKLEQNSLSFLVAFLGNNENQKKFLESQGKDKTIYDDWKIPRDKLKELEHDLKNNLVEILEFNKVKSEIAIINSKLENVKTESNYILENEFDEVKFLEGLNSDKIATLILFLKRNVNKFNIIKRVMFLVIFRSFDFEILNYSSEEIINYLESKYYPRLKEELIIEKELLTEKLSALKFDEKVEEYRHMSMIYLKSFLYGHFVQLKKQHFKKEDIRGRNSTINEYYPVVISTTHSLIHSTRRDFVYDCVIYDEASQIDVVTGYLGLSVAKNAVIVGDSKQLQHVVSQDLKEATNNIFDTFSISEFYSYAKHSFLDSVKYLFNNIPCTMLREHYRCVPEIINFCNMKFYKGELIIMTESKNNDPLKVILTAKGTHEKDKFSQREIDIINYEVLPEIDEDIYEDTCIITPFRNQVKEMESELFKKNVEFDTVHKFQGREKNTVIISTVKNEIKRGDFADQANLLNVAISRAKDKLYIITNEKNTNIEDSNLKDLIKYVDYKNFEITNSEIISPFDALFTVFSEKLKKEYKKPRIISEYKSENIMYEVLDAIFKSENYNTLNYHLGYQLSKVISDYEKLSLEEKKYAKNINTHIDFLIYNRVTKEILCAIEVDGTKFHRFNKKQLQRDKLKNSILDKIGLPYVRLATNKSFIEEKVYDLIKHAREDDNHFRKNYS